MMVNVSSDMIERLERSRDELLAVLKDCRKAIASLQDHELGIDPTIGYPYRDELLHNVDKVIASTREVEAQGMGGAMSSELSGLEILNSIAVRKTMQFNDALRHVEATSAHAKQTERQRDNWRDVAEKAASTIADMAIDLVKTRHQRDELLIACKNASHRLKLVAQVANHIPRKYATMIYGALDGWDDIDTAIASVEKINETETIQN